MSQFIKFSKQEKRKRTQDIFNRYIKKFLKKYPEINLRFIASVNDLKKKVPERYFAGTACIKTNIHNNETETLQSIYYNQNYKQYMFQVPIRQLVIHECGHLLDNHYDISQYIDKILNSDNKEQLDKFIKQIHDKSPFYSKLDISQMFAQAYRLYYYNRLSTHSKNIIQSIINKCVHN